MSSIRRRVNDRPPDLATAVYHRLRGSIVTLRLRPGAGLSELDLCRRLRVSRTPVRAALLRLQQDGLVGTVKVGRTARAVVSPLTGDDMRELFLMVGALDGVAARLAAQRDERTRRRVVQELTAVNTRLRRLSAGDDLRSIRRAQALDRRFHACYEAAGAGPRLLAKLKTLHARRERYVRVYTEALVHAHHVRESVSEHAGIIGALRAGDANAAERLAAFNHRNALERYRRSVAALGEPRSRP